MTTKWTVKSWNKVLGEIGGYTALLWMVINFFMSGYKMHRFMYSMVSKIYLCTEYGPDAPDEQSKDDSERELKKTVTSQCGIGLSYRETFTTWVMTKLCCCCKNRPG